MPLNLDDNKRPYFKQLNLDDTFDEIQNYINNQYKEISITLNTTQMTTQLTSGINIIPSLNIDGDFLYPYGCYIKITKDTTIGTAANLNFRIGSDVISSISRNCLSSGNATFNNLEGYFDFSEVASSTGVNLSERLANRLTLSGSNYTGTGNISIELTIRLKKWK